MLVGHRPAGESIVIGGGAALPLKGCRPCARGGPTLLVRRDCGLSAVLHKPSRTRAYLFTQPPSARARPLPPYGALARPGGADRALGAATLADSRRNLFSPRNNKMGAAIKIEDEVPTTIPNNITHAKPEID
jgi:hypothetical protein